jgi:membrane protein YqaA with SNARE-associated domain
MYSYFLLFGASFLAATVMPFSSEVILFTMMQGEFDSHLLLFSAATGNTLGAAVNWSLGRYLLHYQDRPWFYFKQEQVDKMQYWFQRYGVWSLLFAWLPLGGDVLTFIAGIMKVNFWLFLLLVAIGKTSRYVVIIWLA